MDYRVRATYVMSQIIISTNKFINKCEDGLKQTISKKIYDESVYLINNIEQESNNSNVELLNLLISLKNLGSDYILSEDLLNKLLNIDKEIQNFEYFQLVV